MWCHYDYSAALDQDRASQQNMFDICDSWLGWLWGDSHDSQWEWASIIVTTFQMSSQASTNRTLPIIFVVVVFFTVQQIWRASWQHWLSSMYFCSLVTFGLASLCEILCHREVLPTISKCVFLKICWFLKSVKIWKSSSVSQALAVLRACQVGLFAGFRGVLETFQFSAAQLAVQLNYCR